MPTSFRPGDPVIWLKQVAGEFVFPVRATVLTVTAKRIKIETDDPKEGKVIRHVAPSSLQRQQQPKARKAVMPKGLRARLPKRGRASRPERDEEREHRITYEIVVDAYDADERAMGWYYYIESELGFPFTARCILKRAVSPLHVGDEVEVIGMPPEEPGQPARALKRVADGMSFAVNSTSEFPSSPTGDRRRGRAITNRS